MLPMEVLYTVLALIAVLLIVKIIYTLLSALSTVFKWVSVSCMCGNIEKRSGEVWQLQGAVKNEFGNFSGLLDKAQINIQTGLDQSENVVGVSIKVIQKRLKGVDTLRKKIR